MRHGIHEALVHSFSAQMARVLPEFSPTKAVFGRARFWSRDDEVGGREWVVLEWANAYDDFAITLAWSRDRSYPSGLDASLETVKDHVDSGYLRIDADADMASWLPDWWLIWPSDDSLSLEEQWALEDVVTPEMLEAVERTAAQSVIAVATSWLPRIRSLRGRPG